MSKIKDPTYKDLRKKMSDEEIVESFVLRSTIYQTYRKVEMSSGHCSTNCVSLTFCCFNENLESIHVSYNT